MSLLEVVVALGLFAVMSTSLLVLVTSAARVTGEDARRVVANHLASRELEITRDAFESATRGPDRLLTNRRSNPSPLPGGTAGQDLVVDGVPYTVVRTMQPVSVGSTAATACDEGATNELAYYKVEVEVSWRGLGDRPPVTMNTIMTPRKGTYSDLNGHIGVKVIDASGQPRGAVPVRAVATSGASVGAIRTGDTASDGCVLLAELVTGSYSVTATQPGYVDRAGNATATLSANVQSKQLWRGIMEYDQAARINVTLQPTNAAYALPPATSVPITVGNSGLTPSGTKTITGSGSTRGLADLWPFPSGYQVWAGGCTANDPGDAVAPPVPSAPGGVESTVAAMAPVRVAAPAGTVITARQNADAGCSAGATVNLGVMPAGGILRTSLPYGTWKLSRTGSSTTATVILTPTATPPTEAEIPQGSL